MHINNNSNISKVIITLLAGMIALTACVNLFIVVQSKASSEIYYTVNESIDYDNISNREKSNLTKLVKSLPEQEYNEESGDANIQAVSYMETTIERYLTIKDVDENEKYLYVEYNGGGYAIYDRIAEFIYEKSELGSGPYNEYIDDENLYYGGPSQFYVKENNEYNHIVTGEEATNAEMQEKSMSVEYVRAEYTTGENSEMALSAVQSSTNLATFNLGEELSNDNEYKENANWYFPILAMTYGYNYVSNDKIQMTEMLGKTDAIMGQNLLGSCTYVALSTVMVYYDRIGKANMVPNDISGFELMYDYSVHFKSDYFKNDLTLQSTNLGPLYMGNLSDLSKNLMVSEFLHQKLLYDNYEEHRNKGYDQLKRESEEGTSHFAGTIASLGGKYNKFARANDLSTYSYINNAGTSFLPEAIVDGNPCIVGLNGDYPGSTPKGSGHAVVAYGFTGTSYSFPGSSPLIYTVDSVICNYGWDSGDAEWLGVGVNKNFIYGNSHFNIF